MFVPMIGSPPIPMHVVWPRPASVMAFTISYVRVPLREMTPTSPGRKMRFGMMPIFAWPGDAIPGQFGPMTVTPFERAYGWNSSASWNGMCSVITAMSWMPASTASMTASFAYAAGTKMIDAFAFFRRTASSAPS